MARGFPRQDSIRDVEGSSSPSTGRVVSEIGGANDVL